ncbi:MAG: hypothetical protein FWG40_00035 [Peptococcaceae bacterium]|nr:hypothetical protein [Peptococcaceae bacterium]
MSEGSSVETQDQKGFLKLGKWGRRFCILAAVLLVLVLAFVIFRQTPYYYQTRSYVVLKVYNTIDSISASRRGDKMCVRLPNGRSTPERDWSSQVSVFRPGDDFAVYMGRDVDLTILYNFGAFAWGDPYSSVLDPDSPYYSAFYGAYIVKDPQGPFGFTAEGEADPRMLAMITSYDWSDLVLRSLGCASRVTANDFLNGDYSETTDVSYAGLPGWIRMDCAFEGRGLWHAYRQNQQGYLQYGMPPKEGDGEDFAVLTLYGRAYMRYLEDYDVTLYLYIMAADREVLEACDGRVLSGAVVVL